MDSVDSESHKITKFWRDINSNGNLIAINSTEKMEKELRKRCLSTSNASIQLGPISKIQWKFDKIVRIGIFMENKGRTGVFFESGKLRSTGGE